MAHPIQSRLVPPMRILVRPPLAALALSLLLGACQTMTATAPQAAGTNAAAAPKTAADPKPQALRRENTKLEGPAPETLIGSNQDGILKLVGAPGLVRHEKGVDVWQYAEESCVLLLYFYDDKAGGRKLTYLEAMPKAANTAAVSPAGCLSDQIRAFKAKDLG